MGYLYLTIAIIAEIIATSSLKASENFTKITPSIVVIIGYVVAFYYLSLVLNTISVGIAYAIWSGVGIVCVALLGVILFDQKLDLAAIVGISFIIIGVVIMNVFSRVSGH